VAAKWYDTHPFGKPLTAMKAVLCSRFGGPDDLEIKEIPPPVAGPGEAVVAIKAAALNFFDTLLIAGKYQVKPPFPFSPASEFAGVVESLGPGATGVALGDRAMGWMGSGAARERVAIKTDRLVRLPDGLDFDRAAGLTVTYGTTIHALRDRAQLRPGETLAVLGAAGGTGLAAIELGKIMGARVIACASSADKLAFAREHGADVGVNYGEDDLKEALRRVTDGRGVDVIYDPVGGDYAEAALRSIAWNGRFLVIGFAAGEIPKLPLNLVLLKGCDVRGVFWGQFTERFPEKHRANMAEVLQWASEGKLSAHVHAVYPLEQIADALKALANREAKGKILLRP
jgi:NADPH2:quinone reductase